tara:strand:+ start:22 stop:156 length:135 start_codon:yes stop_codon:yes gene_type:complete
MLAKVRPLKVAETLGTMTTEKAKQNTLVENSIVANVECMARCRI